MGNFEEQLKAIKECVPDMMDVELISIATDGDTETMSLEEFVASLRDEGC